MINIFKKIFLIISNKIKEINKGLDEIRDRGLGPKS